jgi:hypothetical protein
MLVCERSTPLAWVPVPPRWLFEPGDRFTTRQAGIADTAPVGCRVAKIPSAKTLSHWLIARAL